jgi:uncharacterized membrane protein
MIGPLIALLSAGFFGMNKIFLRRGVLKVSDASLGTLISVPMSAPLFFLVIVFTGKTQNILGFSWQGYVWLSLAGILHFVVGRSLNYHCVQLVGANITNLICRSNILVSVVIGITLLREPVSWRLATGVLFIIIGISLPGFFQLILEGSKNRMPKIPGKAFIFGFGCGLAWGISPIFIKLGLKGSGAPISGAFISFLAATLVLAASLVNPKRRKSANEINAKAGVLFFSSGLLSFIANLGRYVALGLAPASIVTPLFSTSPVFVLLFSFVFNRNLEIFSLPVLIGVVTVVIGSILLV